MLRVVEHLGPFGLAFPLDTIAAHTLSCNQARGRPFVTALRAARTAAEWGANDVHEIQLVCGNAATNWTELGPAITMWSDKATGEASCPRPASATGLVVSRSRSPLGLLGTLTNGWIGGHDLYSFGLECGDGVETGQILTSDTLEVEETASRSCADGAYISAIQVRRGFEPDGRFDLLEFSIVCSELAEVQRPNAAAAAEAGSGPPGDARADGAPLREAESAARGDGATDPPASTLGSRRGAIGRRGAPVVGRSSGDDADSVASGEPAKRGPLATEAGSSGRGGRMPRATDDPRPSAGSTAKSGTEPALEPQQQQQLDAIREMLRIRRADAANAAREAKVEATSRVRKRRDEDADATNVFGRVRASAGEPSASAKRDASTEADAAVAGEEFAQKGSSESKAEPEALDETAEAATELAPSSEAAAGKTTEPKRSGSAAGGASAASMEALEERLGAVMRKVNALKSDAVDAEGWQDAARGAASSAGVTSGSSVTTSEDGASKLSTGTAGRASSNEESPEGSRDEAAEQAPASEASSSSSEVPGADVDAEASPPVEQGTWDFEVEDAE